MARILITSGPTRQYIDSVRYLTNASSGLMGASLAEATLELGHEVSIVSGPVDVPYPDAATTTTVISTDEMLAACQEIFPHCDGLIAAAAPCDYRPLQVHAGKISKTGAPLQLELIETDDIVATLGRNKGKRWIVGFALETDDPHLRALAKLERKSCDLIVVNGTEAMHAADNDVDIMDATGRILESSRGRKRAVADRILAVIQEKLIQPRVD